MHSFEFNIRICQPENSEHYFRGLINPNVNRKRIYPFFCYMTLSLIQSIFISVNLLKSDVTADPGVASSIPVRSHTLVEIDHEMISTFILLPSADSFKKGFCQLQAKVCARITGKPLVPACPGKKCG